MVGKVNFNKILAFTLAEVIITLGIIGIIAVVTIPTLMYNINQNVFQSAQDLTIKKIRAATDQMRTDDLIGAYASNDAFADQFQRYFKTVKRCNSTNLQQCFVSTFKTGSGVDINLSDLSTGIDIGQNGNNTSLVGFELITGANMLLAFNPSCDSVNPYNNTVDTTSCMALVYDVNGFGKPNQIGKDIGLLNAKITSCDGTKVGGLCVSGSDTTYAPYGTTTYGFPDYWAGASKACSDLGMRLPTQAEFNNIYPNRAALGMATNFYWGAEVFSEGPRCDDEGCDPPPPPNGLAMVQFYNGFCNTGCTYFGMNPEEKYSANVHLRCVK